jgi:hypothetical protein
MVYVYSHTRKGRKCYVEEGRRKYTKFERDRKLGYIIRVFLAEAVIRNIAVIVFVDGNPRFCSRLGRRYPD